MAVYRAAVRAPAAEVIRHLPPGIKRAVRSAIGEVLANPASAGERRSIYEEVAELLRSKE
jgi:hypothetical protein